MPCSYRLLAAARARCLEPSSAGLIGTALLDPSYLTATSHPHPPLAVHNRPFKGHDAFRHSLFGDTITVERKIAASGTSSYALKDASGR